MPNINFNAQDAIAANSDFKVPQKVTIIGTGGFGSWVGLFAAKAGVSQIVLINHAGHDGKRSRDVEGREIAVGAFEDRHFGIAKVDALEELIIRSNPDVEVVKEKITFDPSSNFDLVKGVVFNGVSNQEIHLKIWEGCRTRGIPCFSGAYNGLKFGSLIDPPVGAVIGGDLPVWVGSAVLSAALAFQSACAKPLAYFGDGYDFAKSGQEMTTMLLRQRMDE